MTKELFYNDEIIINNKPYIVVRTIQELNNKDQYQCIVSNKIFETNN